MMTSETPACPRCRNALREDGWCSHCGPPLRPVSPAPPASTGMETPSEPGHLELTDEAMAARQGGPAVLYVPATPPVSEDIGGLIDAVQREYHGLPFGLSPNTRCVAARTALDAAVASLRRERDGLTAFARDVTTNYDHDADAHRYNNGACLVCKAERALTRPTLERTDG
jgi:hypothetical protein